MVQATTEQDQQPSRSSGQHTSTDSSCRHTHSVSEPVDPATAARFTSENENAIGRLTVSNWMILRGYVPGDGETIQSLLFALEAQLGGQPELPPGEGDFRILRQRVEIAEAEIDRLRSELQSIANSTCCEGCQEAAKWARAALRSKDDREKAATSLTLS